MITVRADMPTMDGRITMTCEPIYEEGASINFIGSRIDPEWVFCDANGHHFELKGFYESVHDTEYYCSDCEDLHGDGIWLCNLCGLVIKPKMISGATIWNQRTPDRYLGMKTTLTYQDEPGGNYYRDRTWIFRNDELTQRILDQGTLNPRDIEELGEPVVESWRQW